MNKQVQEQNKVTQYILCMMPNVEGDYNAMLALLAKANPEVNKDVLTDRKKRILYLQLLAHFVEESCIKIAFNTPGMKINRDISRFSHQVTEFCQSFLHKGTVEDFNALQAQYSRFFLKSWKRILEGIETKEPVLQ